MHPFRLGLLYKFNLFDLCDALADFLDQVNNGQPIETGGRRAADTDTLLPFDHLQVRTKVQLQNRSYHTPHHILPPQTINALSPSEEWISVRCDVVLINTDNNKRLAPQRPRRCLIFLYARLILLISQTRSQGIMSPTCVLFLAPSRPEEPDILLVQIYFSGTLGVSILYLSCLKLAKDNRTRRVRIQSHQLGCIF